MSERTCVVCTQPLTGRQTKFCSRPCSVKGNTLIRIADGRMKAYHDSHRAERSAWLKANRHRYGYDKTCCQCGARFRTADINGIYCGRFCMAQARPPRRPKTQRTPLTVLFVGRACSYCDTAFIQRVEYRTSVPTLAKFCSPRCRTNYSKRQQDRTDRVLINLARWILHERDDCTCHICGEPIDPDANHPDPLSPVLDHVTPRSRGGDDTLDNLRTAHSRCNTIKSDG